MFKKIALLVVTYFALTTSAFAKDDPVKTIENITDKLMTELSVRNNDLKINTKESQ